MTQPPGTLSVTQAIEGGGTLSNPPGRFSDHGKVFSRLTATNVSYGSPKGREPLYEGTLYSQ